MELRTLHYYLAVTQYHTISRAAKALHISQPALSRQLSDLEKELGIQLFKRGPRAITLTEAGRYLQERALTVTKIIDKTTENLQTLTPIVSGSLDIGAGESQGMRLITRVLGQLQADYPEVAIHLHSGAAGRIANQLADGQLDFGIIMGNQVSSQYSALKLAHTDSWGILLPKNTALAQKAVITPQDLVGQPLIVSEQAMNEHCFQNWWQNVSDQLQIVGTYDLIFNAQLLVTTSNCYALAFDNLVPIEDNSLLTFLPLSPALNESTTLIWSKDRQLSSVAQIFLKRLKSITE
ncbi:LysR family transcriptional regulator [Levilactobacillus brevis]|uniref:LysR family transcriptional regulator n=1 Tax=Levilactobacillus brevis TaxID=1580 RepID=UPI000E006BD8|nr:LysR family transcriptional regulator [Levilactobacillus brevis]STX19658.1 transcriptional regulator [Levilactobacillus brevis]